MTLLWLAALGHGRLGGGRVSSAGVQPITVWITQESRSAEETPPTPPDGIQDIAVATLQESLGPPELAPEANEVDGPPTETPAIVALRARATVSKGQLNPYPCDRIAGAGSAGISLVARVYVHVGADGRPIETEVGQVSGIRDLNEALRQCAMHWPRFPALIVDGRAIEYWQRVDWHS